VNSFTQMLRNLGMARLFALAIVAMASVAFLSFAVSRLTAPPMSLLFSDLDPKDSGKIVGRLDALGIPYEVTGDGGQIRVPRDQALSLRMTFAGEGLPSGGSIGYEIFDQADSLGTTSFVQNINSLRALEGELSRTIASISPIRAARVHLVIPERQLFTRDRPAPSASIVLTLAGGDSLDRGQVAAVQHLVSAAVPGLKPSAISIIDNHGTLLARNVTEGEGADFSGGTSDEMRTEFENRLARSIEGLIERSAGYGKVRARVSAEMNFDRVTTSAETFNPDGQVVRSTQSVTDESSSGGTSSAGASGPVSVSGNLPGANAAGNSGAVGDSSTRNEETVNYEISKTVETKVQEAGEVRRLSVAVLVDGTYATAADGTSSYAPRSPEEMAQIDKLVRSAMGFNADRGDTLEVANMRFADEAGSTELAAAGGFLGLDMTTGDLVYAAEILTLLILGVIVLLFVIRPIVGRLLVAGPPRLGGGGQTFLPGSAGAPAAIGGPGPQTSQALAEAQARAERAASEIDQMLDLNQVEGRVRASSVKKIGEIVDRHPEEAVNIIRNWMYQSA